MSYPWGEDLVVDQVYAFEPTDWQVTEGEAEHRTQKWDQIFFQALFISVELSNLEVAYSIVDNLEVVQIVVMEDTMAEE